MWNMNVVKHHSSSAHIVLAGLHKTVASGSMWEESTHHFGMAECAADINVEF
jgi:hypothetical protein